MSEDGTSAANKQMQRLVRKQLKSAPAGSIAATKLLEQLERLQGLRPVNGKAPADAAVAAEGETSNNVKYAALDPSWHFEMTPANVRRWCALCRVHIYASLNSHTTT